MAEAKVRTTAKELALPKLQAIRDFNLDELGDPENLTDEKLMELQPRILELIMHGMMVSDMAKEESDIPGLTIKEQFLGKPAPTLDTEKKGSGV